MGEAGASTQLPVLHWSLTPPCISSRAKPLLSQSLTLLLLENLVLLEPSSPNNLSKRFSLGRRPSLR